MDLSSKLAGLSRAELEEILANEDKINDFALSSESVKSLQEQRDQGNITTKSLVPYFIISNGAKSNLGK